MPSGSAGNPGVNLRRQITIFLSGYGHSRCAFPARTLRLRWDRSRCRWQINFSGDHFAAIWSDAATAVGRWITNSSNTLLPRLSSGGDVPISFRIVAAKLGIDSGKSPHVGDHQTLPSGERRITALWRRSQWTSCLRDRGVTPLGIARSGNCATSCATSSGLTL
jgi:hypothetical protein